LEVRVVRIGPRLILRWGRGIERLTRVGWLGEIGVRRVRAIMKFRGGGRIVLLGGRIRVLVLGVGGRGRRIVLGGRRLARGDVVRDARTTEDGFVGCDSLVRLAWTEWSIHHLDERRA